MESSNSGNRPQRNRKQKNFDDYFIYEKVDFLKTSTPLDKGEDRRISRKKRFQDKNEEIVKEVEDEVSFYSPSIYSNTSTHLPNSSSYVGTISIPGSTPNKKRGRPSKVTPNKSDILHNVASPTLEENKRKRNFENVEESIEDVQSKSGCSSERNKTLFYDEPPPKKRRGRPKKLTIDDSLPQTATSDVEHKKSFGQTIVVDNTKDTECEEFDKETESTEQTQMRIPGRPKRLNVDFNPVAENKNMDSHADSLPEEWDKNVCGPDSHSPKTIMKRKPGRPKKCQGQSNKSLHHSTVESNKGRCFDSADVQPTSGDFKQEERCLSPNAKNLTNEANDSYGNCFEGGDDIMKIELSVGGNCTASSDIKTENVRTSDQETNLSTSSRIDHERGHNSNGSRKRQPKCTPTPIAYETNENESSNNINDYSTPKVKGRGRGRGRPRGSRSIGRGDINDQRPSNSNHDNDSDNKKSPEEFVHSRGCGRFRTSSSKARDSTSRKGFDSGSNKSDDGNESDVSTGDSEPEYTPKSFNNARGRGRGSRRSRGRGRGRGRGNFHSLKSNDRTGSSKDDDDTDDEDKSNDVYSTSTPKRGRGRGRGRGSRGGHKASPVVSKCNDNLLFYNILMFILLMFKCCINFIMVKGV